LLPKDCQRSTWEGGREIAEGIDGFKDEYVIEKICSQAARHKVGILFGDTRLPEKRPDVSTGLVYALVNKDGRTFEESVEYHKRAKEFWSNKYS